MKASPRACRHCGSPAKFNPCWWGVDHSADGGDPPCQLYYEDEEEGPHRMSWLWWMLIVYAVGFGATFAFNISIGPVTPGLSLLRAAVWPLYWLTGWPAGQRF